MVWSTEKKREMKMCKFTMCFVVCHRHCICRRKRKSGHRLSVYRKIKMVVKTLDLSQEHKCVEGQILLEGVEKSFMMKSGRNKTIACI